MIKVVCDFCKKELMEPGGLFFGPPNREGIVHKDHVCIECCGWITEIKAKLKDLRETNQES